MADRFDDQIASITACLSGRYKVFLQNELQLIFELVCRPDSTLHLSWATIRALSIRRRFQPNMTIHARYILRGTSASFFIRITGAALALVLQIILARTLGKEEYGVYLYLFSWVTLISVISRLGLDSSMPRFLPVMAARQEWGKLKGTMVRWRRPARQPRHDHCRLHLHLTAPRVVRSRHRICSCLLGYRLRPPRHHTRPHSPRTTARL